MRIKIDPTVTLGADPNTYAVARFQDKGAPKPGHVIIQLISEDGRTAHAILDPAEASNVGATLIAAGATVMALPPVVRPTSVTLAGSTNGRA